MRFLVLVVRGMRFLVLAAGQERVGALRMSEIHFRDRRSEKELF